VAEGERLLELVAVQDRLRSPGGCPWDAAQTHQSLVPYLLEETYECVEAIETRDRAHLREELGDLLMQVVFHARIAAEDRTDPWSIDDVAGDIADKLVRRHPHVFGDVEANTPAEVEANWEQLKAAEKGRTSIVDGIPVAQPALALADALWRRAERAGVPAELLPRGDDIGAQLFRLVADARAAGVDPEAALRAAARDFRDRVLGWEETSR
jgi:XTP/dITP diphosphohydrolase